MCPQIDQIHSLDHLKSERYTHAGDIMEICIYFYTMLDLGEIRQNIRRGEVIMFSLRRSGELLMRVEAPIRVNTVFYLHWN